MKDIFMNKWMGLITGILLIDSSVEGWGGRYRANIEQQAAELQALPQNFPGNSDQGWFTDENYLLWKPTLGDVQYVNRVSLDVPSSNTKNFTVKMKDPDFGWNSGVRVGVGRYLPHRDKWDVSGYMTYFYGETSDKSTANTGHNVALTPLQSPVANIVSISSGFQWKLNYFVWDLMVGREFTMTPKITFHPYMGLRAALINQDYKENHRGGVLTNFTNTATLDSSFEDDFWGVGVRIGSDFNYTFKRQWALIGNLAASLLYGRHETKEKSEVTHRVPIANMPTFYAHQDHENTVRTNIEGAIGLGWETWLRNETVRLAPAILYEGSLWLDMNHFFRPHSTFSQNQGSLGLMGLTFNLHVDF